MLVILASQTTAIEFGPDGGGNETTSTSESPSDVVSTTAASTSGRGRNHLKIKLQICGFSCGFGGRDGNELCISLEQGICVRLKGKRRHSRSLIIVVEDTIGAPVICKGRRMFREV